VSGNLSELASFVGLNVVPDVVLSLSWERCMRSHNNHNTNVVLLLLGCKSTVDLDSAIYTCPTNDHELKKEISNG